jgi:hypothetical protein
MVRDLLINLARAAVVRQRTLHARGSMRRRSWLRNSSPPSQDHQRAKVPSKPRQVRRPAPLIACDSTAYTAPYFGRSIVIFQRSGNRREPEAEFMRLRQQLASTTIVLNA